MVPSPATADFVRAHRHAKGEKGTIPHKTYRLRDRVERRDSFNGIIPEPGTEPSSEPEAKVTLDVKESVTDLKEVQAPLQEVPSPTHEANQVRELPQEQPIVGNEGKPISKESRTEEQVPAAVKAPPSVPDSKIKAEEVHVEFKTAEDFKAPNDEPVQEQNKKRTTLEPIIEAGNEETPAKQTGKAEHVLQNEQDAPKQELAVESPMRESNDADSSPAPASRPPKPVSDTPKCGCQLL